MSDPNHSFGPLIGTAGPGFARLGRGDYTATRFGSLLAVRAEGVRAFGIDPQATLVAVPGNADETRLVLYVEERDPELASLSILTAETTVSAAGAIATVAIFDVDTGAGPDAQPKLIPVTPSE